MRTSRNLLARCCALFALGACTTKADPEEPPPAAISGVVTDLADGAALARVAITVADVTDLNVQPIAAGEATTSTSGAYRVTGLDAGRVYRVVARADGYDGKTESVTAVEGENPISFALARSVVCAVGQRRCTIAPAAPAILTCNASGTGYDSSPCAPNEECNLQTTSCGAPSSLTIRVIEQGGQGRVTSVPSGIACPPDCEERYPAGTEVTLTPTPLGEAIFSRWNEDCVGTAPCTLTVTGEKSAIATFVGSGPSVTVRKTGRGSANITSTPPGIDCGSTCSARFPTDTRVTLVVQTTNRSAFVRWVGCEPADMPRCQVVATMGAAAEVELAAFYERPLRADMGCRLLLGFSRGSLVQGCGGGEPAVATGTVSFVASRDPTMGDALEIGGAGAWVETHKVGINQMRSTVEMTVHRLGPAFDGAGRGAIYSDWSGPDGHGVALYVEDDGRLRGVTRSEAGMSTEVASMPGVIAVGAWAHVELLMDATRGLRLKVDNALVADTTGAPAWTQTSSTAWLGASRAADGSARERFFGRIDEVRMGDYGRD